jgi:hypothetical protein
MIKHQFDWLSVLFLIASSILLAMRAYVRLEYHRWRWSLSLFNAKLDIVRAAVRFYVAHPTYCLPSTA